MTLLRKLSAVGAAAMLAVLTTALPASATTTGPAWKDCSNLKDFYVNEDETARTPAPTAPGLEFKNDQLIHHAKSMDLKDVHPGTYTVADGHVSLDDFFSIEVSNPTAPHNYGTLRYEATGPNAGKWNIGGTSFYDTDAVKLATDHNRSTNMVSFGVGYVANPATGTRAVISAITFHGVTYDLTCKPKPSPSVSTSASVKPSPSASRSAGTVVTHRTTSSPAATGALAVTGPPVWGFALVGGSVALLGVAAYLLTRRRTNRFTA